jgi:4-diphosphocytidyl-2-C-methyl-D-erythritol kinase
MVVFPACKINLGLNVIRKRDDGYHDIETCFYPVPLTDILEIIPSESTEFTTSGNIIPGKPEENLCLKAYYLLSQEFSLAPVRIHLHKIIPTGAGLGGGSSDAAQTLRLLSQMFALNLTDNELSAFASQLGSDCSFFIHDRPMIGSRRGEILAPSSVRLAGKFMVLLHPGLHVSTAEAYSGVVPGEPPLPVETIVSGSVEKWRKLLQNDFELTVFSRFPLISNLKDELYQLGAVYASMSGSGSAVFGIFDQEVSTENTPVHSYVIWKGALAY